MDRRGIEVLSLELPDGRRQVLLAFPNAAVPSQRIEKESVDPWLERRQLEPPVQMHWHFLVRDVSDELLEQRGVPGTEPTPLGGKPSVEARAAVDLQAVEEVPDEHGGQNSQPLRRERSDLRSGPGDLERVDEAVPEVETDSVRLRFDPLPARLIEETPNLAQAPAKLTPGIIRDVPEQVAKLAAGHGMGRQRQIGQECSHLARRRQS